MKIKHGGNPYPKISPSAMRQDAAEKHANWHSRDIDAGKMRGHAESNQEDHSNLPNGQLNGFDRKDGAIKGGC